MSTNIEMRSCFQSQSARASLSLFALLLTASSGSAGAAGISSARVRTVVRADARSGRLVRAFIVSPSASPKAADDAGRPGAAFDAVNFVNLPEIVEATAKKYDVDPLLVHAVIQVESGYNQNAVSHKGAQGLMQLMPETARRFGVRNSFDVRENIEGGVRYLRYLTGLFPQDVRLALAAYNAGEGAVWKYKYQIPPYRETEEYVKKVGGRYTRSLRDAEARQLAKSEGLKGAEPVPAEPTYARVESFLDAEGRLHLRTIASPDTGVRNP